MWQYQHEDSAGLDSITPVLRDNFLGNLIPKSLVWGADTIMKNIKDLCSSESI